MNSKKLIAVTGGIGSGKSVAVNVLSLAGYNTLSCDDITTDLYEKRKVKLLLKKLFPSAVKGFFNPVIDRKEISKIVFNDAKKLKILTDAITPLVLNEVLARAKKLSGKIFVEVPLLFECNYQDSFDGVIVITRPLNARIESVMARSNLTEEQVVGRIKSQVDYENIDLTPYHVIENTGDLEQLKNNVLSLAKEI